MVTSLNLVYSASAVRRLLGLSAFAPIEMHLFAEVVWVWVKGHRPTFISKAAFQAHFIERRQALAQYLAVTRNSNNHNLFTVRNPSKQSVYRVQLQFDALICQCQDYENQVQFLGQGCCKHGYAVLQYLGLDSLQKSLDAAEPANHPSLVAA
jgi:hypothetical protein